MLKSIRRSVRRRDPLPGGVASGMVMPFILAGADQLGARPFRIESPGDEEEAPDQSFESYLAARNAVAAYGLSEEFENDQHFTRASSNSTLRVLNLPGISTADPHAQALPTFYVPFGAGKTCVILSTFTRAAGKFSNLLPIVPAPTTVTSGSPESLFTVTQGASMASEPAAITEEQSVDEIIRRIRTTLPARFRIKLAARISELEQAVQEEESDGRGIEARSLHQFLELLKTYPALRCPIVSVTPERNVYASWKVGTDRVFSVHFFPDGKVRFVIFYPNNKHAGGVIRVSGTATVDVVISVAAPHGILDWATDEGPSNPRF